VKRVVADASALAAVIFQEPASPIVEEALDGAIVFAPTLLIFELANAALKKMRRSPADGPRILSALARGLEGRWRLNWHNVEPTDVTLVANATGLSIYDASYLWLAGALGADLVTLDERLAAASAERLV
jgi:predicted nucleic acid-binding protein